MKVFVDTKFGVTFTFDGVDPRNTKVFDIKNSIETNQGIPVSIQTLYFDGAELAVDHYQLRVYRIVNNSRLLLEVRDDHVNNQMLLRHSPYAIQGFVPSITTSNYEPPSHANTSESFLNQDSRMMPRRSDQVLHQTQISTVPPSHASEAFFNQDQRTMGRSNQVPPSHASEALYNEDPRTMARSNQVVPPSQASEALYNEDQRTMARSHQVPPSHASEAFYNQDRLVSNEGQAYESVLESFSMDEFLERAPEPWTAQDSRKLQGIWPGTTGDNVNVQESSGRANKNQDLFQSDKSPPPQKLTVTMTQYDKPGGDFLVDVNASDNVEELRKQLEKIQHLDLPAKGYFLIHNERVLDDDKSFSMNRVANGDTIEIFHGPDIEDFSFGHDPRFSTEAIANENHMFQTDRSSTFGDHRLILTDEIINKNQVFQTESNSTEERINTQDFPVRVVSRDKVFQTEKLIVIMTQYDKPGRKFLVEVNESDNVEELKKVLVNIQQKYQLDLPTKGYFLIHNERVLDDDKSFSMNRVANGDTIEIFPGPDIEE